MGFWDIGMSHIVDVDGQLLAIDAEVIDTTSLLARAKCHGDRQLWQVRAGERFELAAKQLIRLSRDEVLFFESSATCRVPAVQRLAA